MVKFFWLIPSKVQILFRLTKKSEEKTSLLIKYVLKFYYSTVINYSSTTNKSSATKAYSLRVSVELKSSNLWSPPYSHYQQELFGIITKFHEDDGLNFKQISDWLVANQYQTPRGKIFTQSHCWSIYKKKNTSNERFAREFEPIIKDMSIDVVDYIPVQ